MDKKVEFDVIVNNSNTNTDSDTDDIDISDSRRKSIKIIFDVFAVLMIIISIIWLFIIGHTDYIEGNILKLAIGNGTKLDTQTVGNPWKNASFSGQLIFRSLFMTDETLTEINPDLCSDYDIINDGLGYVITLGDDLKWSDGQPITIDDVVFSIEAFMHCSDVNVNISAAFNKIVGTDDYINGKADYISGLEVDGNKLTIHLESRYNAFLSILTQFVPLPKHILQDEDLSTLTSGHEFFINDNSVGNGMYKSIGLDNDYNLVFEQNKHYTGVKPNIDKVIFYWDYQNMDIDYYATNNITEMVSYRAMRGFDEYPIDVYFYRYFVFNIKDEDGITNDAMNDIRVRQAITHAIDRETLLADVYFNTGHLIFGGSAIAANTELYEYNPHKAKTLLEEAEYDFNRPLRISYYYNDETSYIFLQKVAEYLEKVGLIVEISHTIGSDNLYEVRDYDMMLKGLSSFNTEDWYNEFLSTNANMSKLFGNYGEFDELIDNLNSVTTKKQYNAVLKEIVDLEQSLVYKLPLFTLNQFAYINANRLQVPEDIVFGNTRYRSDLRIDEWAIKKE